MSIEKLHFTYEPITLTKLFLQMYAEKHIEGKDRFKAIQFACYEYLRTITDEEVETLLFQFIEKESLEEITFDDWTKDCKSIFDCIFETNRYKELLLNYQKQGYNGLGVVDNKNNIFYRCATVGHWKKVEEIMKEKYPDLYKALMETNYGLNRDSYNGISREELDNFILTNFELISASKILEFYLD